MKPLPVLSMSPFQPTTQNSKPRRTFYDRVQLEVRPTEYFLACARIRDISPTALLRRLVDTLSEDQLITAVLDDADAIKKRRPGEHGFGK